MKRLASALFVGLLVFGFTSLGALEIANREMKSVQTMPEYVDTLFTLKKAALVKELGEAGNSLGDEELYVIFCSIVAHKMAPYGYSTATNLYQMLKAPVLNCGNYGVLLVQLAEAGNPRIFDKVIPHFVGWEGNAFGNHQTIFIASPRTPGILLDPTTGLVAMATFNQVAAGVPIPSSRVFDFCSWDKIASFRNKVKTGIVMGWCRPSDILYYFATCDGFLYYCTDKRGHLINPDTTLWMTPAGQKRNYP